MKRTSFHHMVAGADTEMIAATASKFDAAPAKKAHGAKSLDEVGIDVATATDVVGC